MVLAAFLILVGASIVIFPPERQPIAFFISIAAVVVMLLAICYAKGEPPRWRWGDDSSPK